MDTDRFQFDTGVSEVSKHGIGLRIPLIDTATVSNSVNNNFSNMPIKSIENSIIFSN